MGVVPHLPRLRFLVERHEMAPFRTTEDQDFPAYLPQELVHPETESADSGDPGHGEKRNLAGRDVVFLPVFRRKWNRFSKPMPLERKLSDSHI
jgi:hypothetical protein